MCPRANPPAGERGGRRQHRDKQEGLRQVGGVVQLDRVQRARHRPVGPQQSLLHMRMSHLRLCAC